MTQHEFSQPWSEKKQTNYPEAGNLPIPWFPHPHILDVPKIARQTVQYAKGNRDENET